MKKGVVVGVVFKIKFMSIIIRIGQVNDTKFEIENRIPSRFHFCTQTSVPSSTHQKLLCSSVSSCPSHHLPIPSAALPLSRSIAFVTNAAHLQREHLTYTRYTSHSHIHITIMKSVFILAAVAGSAAAFTGSTPTFTRARSSLNMGGSSGYATSMPGKTAKITNIKGLLDTSELIFSIDGSALSVLEVQSLRRSLPEGTTMSMIKNTLMSRACAGTDYEEATADMLKGSNMWFFIEEDIGGTVKSFNSFTKEFGKKESHAIKAGVVEGVAYDEAGVVAISKLPSKIELITMIAGSIKAVPTKVARVIKAPGEKTARAIKLATEKASE